jgi:hypothetical protein
VKRSLIAGFLCAVLVSTAACGDDAVRPATGKDERKQTLPEGGVWLAVLRVEDDPNLLDRDVRDLRKPAGRSLVVAQVSCFDGLEQGLEIEDEEGGEGAENDTTPGTYILGLQSAKRKKVNKLLKKTGWDPIAVVGVVDRCLGN